MPRKKELNVACQQLTLVIPQRINLRIVCNALVDCFEANEYSRNWIKDVDYVGYPVLPGHTWYSDPKSLTEPRWRFRIYYVHPDHEKLQRKVIKLSHIKRALRKMSYHSPHQFAQLMVQDGDWTTSDIFLQYVVMGEVHYG